MDSAPPGLRAEPSLPSQAPVLRSGQGSLCLRPSTRNWDVLWGHRPWEIPFSELARIICSAPEASIVQLKIRVQSKREFGTMNHFMEYEIWGMLHHYWENAQRASVNLGDVGAWMSICYSCQQVNGDSCEWVSLAQKHWLCLPLSLVPL